jgi:hypothetical protein
MRADTHVKSVIGALVIRRSDSRAASRPREWLAPSATVSASIPAVFGSLLPIEDQRAYGESFRRLWHFVCTLRTAYDEGTAFVRHLIDATASLLCCHPVRRPSSRAWERLASSGRRRESRPTIGLLVVDGSPVRPAPGDKSLDRICPVFLCVE